MHDCIFCKIVSGELPCYKIWEDNLFVALLDAYPRSRGHTLVIPKKHYRWVYDVPEFDTYWEVVLKITRGLQKSLHPYFITYITHGLQVPHAHIHLLPRDESQTEFVPAQITLPKEEFISIASSIIKALSQ